MDPKIIKESLPEFYGRLEENPTHFLNNVVNLLGRTNIPSEIYLHLVSQQLKGQASTWWQNLKGLCLGWEEFKTELLARFDSEGVRAAVQRKFLTEAQPAGMRAGAFVLQKYQLFKRLHQAEDGKGALPNIIDLLRD